MRFINVFTLHWLPVALVFYGYPPPLCGFTQAADTAPKHCPTEYLALRRQRRLLQYCRYLRITGRYACNVYCNGPEMYRKSPDVAVEAISGLEEAIRECQWQMRLGRWNCIHEYPHRQSYTMLHNPPLLNHGFKESAFLLAISSAGVTWSVARACSLGKIPSCRCDLQSHAGRQQWEWGGCNYNVKFGLVTSRKLLAARKHVDAPHSSMRAHFVNHNLKAGRLAVKKTLNKLCKCHGVSGSCQMKTCWKTAARLREIGSHLKEKFDAAQRLHIHGQVNVTDAMVHQKVRPTALVYHENSPDFCAKNPHFFHNGTFGRICGFIKNDEHIYVCDKLCCGRGQRIVDQNVTENCNCRFHWCCEVKCEQCVHTQKLVSCY